MRPEDEYPKTIKNTEVVESNIIEDGYPTLLIIYSIN